jgi:hypothetical protein
MVAKSSMMKNVGFSAVFLIATETRTTNRVKNRSLAEHKGRLDSSKTNELLLLRRQQYLKYAYFSATPFQKATWF